MRVQQDRDASQLSRRWVRFTDPEVYILCTFQGAICFTVINAARKSRDLYIECSVDRFANCNKQWGDFQALSTAGWLLLGGTIVEYSKTAYRTFPIIQRAFRACFSASERTEPEENPDFFSIEDYVFWVFQTTVLVTTVYVAQRSESKYLECRSKPLSGDCSEEFEDFQIRYGIAYSLFGGAIGYYSRLVSRIFSPFLQRGVERVFGSCLRRRYQD